MSKIVMCLALFAALLLVGCGPAAAPTPTPTPTVVPGTPVPSPTPEPSPTEPPPTPEPTPTPEDYPAPPVQPTPEDYPVPPVQPTPEGYPYPEPAVTPQDPYPEPEAADTTDWDQTRWVFDGEISEGEYTDSVAIGDIMVYWAHDGKYIYLAAEAETPGWLSIGIDPERGMQGADYILAIHDGEPQIWDAYGVGTRGATHPPDTELGGTFDFIEWAVAREGEWLRFEVLRLLDTGDEYDKAMEPGETYVILAAVGVEPEFNAPHFFRSHGEMTLE